MIVRIKGIKKARAKGHIYYYHRATKQRIEAPPNTAAFIAEVRRLDNLAQLKPATKTSARQVHKSGTWGALVADYRASPEFARLAPRSKSDYGRVLDYLAELDDMPLMLLDSAMVIGIRDRAFEKHKRRFANYVLMMLSVVMAWGCPAARWRRTPLLVSKRSRRQTTRPRPIGRGAMMNARSFWRRRRGHSKSPLRSRCLPGCAAAMSLR